MVASAAGIDALDFDTNHRRKGRTMRLQEQGGSYAAAWSGFVETCLDGNLSLGGDLLSVVGKTHKKVLR
jgi:hypothetical protein